MLSSARAIGMPTPSLLQTFSITDGVYMQFGIEAFNVFDQINFLFAVNDSPLFGYSGVDPTAAQPTVWIKTKVLNSTLDSLNVGF